MMYLNFLANIIIAISVTGFIAMIQNNNSILAQKHLLIRLWIKVSLALTAGGALLNTLTLSNPPFTEVILNLGLAGIFSFAYFLHLDIFKKKKQ